MLKALLTIILFVTYINAGSVVEPLPATPLPPTRFSGVPIPPTGATHSGTTPDHKTFCESIGGIFCEAGNCAAFSCPDNYCYYPSNGAHVCASFGGTTTQKPQGCSDGDK